MYYYIAEDGSIEIRRYKIPKRKNGNTYLHGTRVIFITQSPRKYYRFKCLHPEVFQGERKEE